jgi:catalase
MIGTDQYPHWAAAGMRAAPREKGMTRPTLTTTAGAPISDNQNSITAGQRERLMDNLVASMGGVPEEILRRQIAHFSKADPRCGAGAGVAARLGLSVEAVAAE